MTSPSPCSSESPLLVSIVMPAYKAAHLKSALESVVAQTYPAIEIVVCDDSRDDEIASIVLISPDSQP